MRTTPVCLALHIDRAFKFQWMISRRKRIQTSDVEKILSAKGIKVFDPKEILSPPFQRKVPEIPPLVRKEDLIVEKTPCFIFGNRFSPPAGLAQIQCLTNTVIRTTLPESVLSCVSENSAEEDSKVQAAILHSHLLDSHQEKLPRMIDLSRPGWSFPREYGMRVARKNKSMTYQLMLLLEQLYPEAVPRHMVEKAKTQVTLENKGCLFQTQQEAAFVFSSTTPLVPSANEVEILATEDEPLPDIYPLSPFLNCRKRTQYSDEEYDCVASGRYFPHTLFIHMNMPKMPHTDDNFMGITLLKAFSHAAAYAKCWSKIENGVLEKPLAVQVVHTNGKKYHVGVLQLNTLDLNGQRKNIFWHLPSETLFEKCSFKVAKAELEGYNPRVFSLLKALHVQ